MAELRRVLFVLCLLSASATPAGEPGIGGVDQLRKLDSFDDVKAFERYIEAHTQACLDRSFGGGSAARCFVAQELWDRELNIAYARLRERLDEAGREKLKRLQLAWIAHRDSTAEFNGYMLDRHFDEPGTMWIGVRARSADATISALTKARTLLLREWDEMLVRPVSRRTSATKQTEMNRSACDEAKLAESALRSEYESLLGRHASDPEVQALIEAAERAYEAFREAHLAAYSAAVGGSVAPMCTCLSASSLANAQRSFVAADPEGDVCAW